MVDHAVSPACQCHFFRSFHIQCHVYVRTNVHFKMANWKIWSCAVGLLFISSFSFVYPLSFTLSAGTKKCLREEVHKDILVTGEYRLSEANIVTDLIVSVFEMPFFITIVGLGQWFGLNCFCCHC